MAVFDGAYAKLKHWCGVWGIFGLEGARVLGFGTITDDFGTGFHLAGFRDLLVGVLSSRRSGNLLFAMNILVQFCGMTGSNGECYAAAVPLKLS